MQEIIPGFNEEMLKYKKQLRAVREGLGLSRSDISIKKSTLTGYELIPNSQNYYRYTNLPDAANHAKMIKIFKKKDKEKQFVERIAWLELLHQDHILPALSKRHEEANLARIQSWEPKTGELVEGFSPELVRYKKLLRKIRQDFGLMQKQVPEVAEVSKVTYFFWEALPFVGTHREYLLLPNEEAHNKMLKFFSQKSAVQENKLAQEIAEFNELHKKYVVPELQRRKDNCGRDPLIHHSGEDLEIEPQTHLTRLLAARIIASEYGVTELQKHLSGQRIRKVLTLLDHPNSGTDYEHLERARPKLDELISFENFGFTVAEKENIRQLFYINCWDSVLDGKELHEMNPVAAYKLTLKALLLQAGLNGSQVGWMLGGTSHEFVRLILSQEKFERGGHYLPNPEQHKKFCRALRELCAEEALSVDMEDVESFERLYISAYAEKLRQNELRGQILDTEGMTPLGKCAAKIMEARKIAMREVAAVLDISDSVARFCFTSPKLRKAQKLAEILMHKSITQVDIDDSAPTYELWSEDGVNIRLMKQNFAPSGLNGYGKNFIPGYSGLSWAEEEELKCALEQNKKMRK